MFKKTCPYCKKDSYSAASKGEWICPYCDKDLSNVPPETAIAHKETSTGNKPKRYTSKAPV